MGSQKMALRPSPQSPARAGERADLGMAQKSDFCKKSDFFARLFCTINSKMYAASRGVKSTITKLLVSISPA